jgi:hypothetical protein
MGWRPGDKPGSRRWATWGEYLHDYRGVRAELVARFETRRAGRPPEQWFAERLDHAARRQPKADVEKLGRREYGRAFLGER